MSGFLCSMVGASFTVAAVAQVLRSKKGITAVGNAQVDTAQSYFGGASALFDGTGDYLNVGETGDFAFSTGNFTVEAFIRNTKASSTRKSGIFSKRNFDNVNSGGWGLYLTTDDGKIGWEQLFSGGSSFEISTTISASTWYHVAVVRNGSGSNNMAIYIDGTSRATWTDTTNYTNVNQLKIGSFNDSTQGNTPTDSVAWQGFIDEMRISDSARYTTTFTPSTTPFVNDANTLLLIHANGTDGSTFFEDDNGVRSSTSLIATGAAKVSTTQSKFGGSSANFDGSSNTQVLVRSWNTSSYTGDFTIEGWFYITDKTTSTNARIWSDGDGSTTEDFRLLQFEYSTNQIYMVTGQSGNDSWNYSYVSATLNINTWYHIAASRSGSSLRIFVNGTQQGSTISNSLAFTSASSNHSGRLGMFRTDASRYRGFIDDFRISNSARYTAAFTAPTAPFVNDANTLLLIHADGTDATTVFEDDNGARAPKGISALGNAQIDTAQSKFGGASALFDGTGDYLDTNFSSTIAATTGSATVECFIRITSTGSVLGICNQSASGDTNGFTVLIISGNIYAYWRGSATYTMVSTTTLSTNTWHHIAIVNDNGTGRLFINGAQEDSDAGWGDGYTTTTNFIVGRGRGNGSGVFDGTNYDFNGWIDEFRVSDTARYTANFTPSTTPFQSDANTVLLLHMDGTDASTVFFDDNGIAPYTP